MANDSFTGRYIIINLRVEAFPDYSELSAYYTILYFSRISDV